MVAKYMVVKYIIFMYCSKIWFGVAKIGNWLVQGAYLISVVDDHWCDPQLESLATAD